MGKITNEEIARIMREIGEYLAMDNIPFKPRAYERAAETISALEESLSDIYARGGIAALKELPSIGEAIAEKIEELVKTGKSKYYAKLKKQEPVDLTELGRVEGLGPKKIHVLFQKLGVRNLKDLEKAAKAGKIAQLEGFGKKTEENILIGIGFVKRSKGRALINEALPLAREIRDRLAKLKEVEQIDIAGSLRRRKETIGDIDMLIVSSTPEPVMDVFVQMPEVARVLGHGETKSSVTLNNNIDMDLRVVPAKSYGAALNYFTGSKDHNIAMRRIAIEKGMKLSEYGIFRGEKQIAGKTEKEIYETLGMHYIEPEMREMTGEIEAAQAGKLPELIGYDDLAGDLQTQTNWTDGADSIEAMAKAAQTYGLSYIVITDHTKRLAMTGGLDAKRAREQMKEIDALNEKISDSFRVLKGIECDILQDGSLDLPDDVLREMDVVGVSVHSHFKLSRAEQTARVVKAIQNPHVDILFHPTGRLIHKRDAIDLDIEEIIRVAKETGTVLEINAFPDRLDLKDEYIRMCVNAGVKMAIDSDAHSAHHFALLEYGIAQARRGWATRSDVINAWPVEKMLSMLKGGR